MESRDRAKAAVVMSVSTAHLYLRPIVRQSARTSASESIWMEFQTRSGPFRLKSTVRSFGLRDLPQSGECSRAALRFSIEEILSIEIEGGSFMEFGSAKMPSRLRPAGNEARNFIVQVVVS